MLKKCKGCGDKILPDDYYNFACPECGEENNRQAEEIVRTIW